jgi:thioredoxin
MFRFKAIAFLIAVAAMVLAACQPAAPTANEESPAPAAPVETEAPAATEPPAAVATDEPSPLPSDTPDSISVPTVAPASESVSCPTGASTATVVEITDGNYQEEILQSPVPVLIHFWAEWVGPSRLLAPMIEEIANEYAGSVKVGKVNVDDYPPIADQFSVTQLPTLIIINHGSEQARIVGETSKEEICQALDQQLGNSP